MNILYIDANKYNMDEAMEMFQSIRKEIKDDLVCLPTDTRLILNADLDSLKTIRDMVDKAIAEKEAT